MDELAQSNLEKETNDSHNTCYISKHNVLRRKENAFIKNYKCDLFSLVFVIKLGRSMTETFSIGLQKTTEKCLKP